MVLPFLVFEILQKYCLINIVLLTLSWSLLLCKSCFDVIVFLDHENIFLDTIFSNGGANLHISWIYNKYYNVVLLSIVFIDHENICRAYRHRFHGSTIFSFQDIIENMIFSNGGTALHFFQNAQRCQEGIIQFRNIGYIRIRKNAIKRCMDPKTRCSRKSSFYSRTM